MADFSGPNDETFVPPQYGNTFDFTLAFEHGMFTILPSSLFIAAFPALLYYYARKPVIVDYGWLFFAKIASVLCLFGVEVGILVLWTKYAHSTVLAIVASSLSCVAVLCTNIILGIEHRHSFRPSSALSIYFAITALFGIAMARSCVKRSDLGLHTQGALFATTSALRGVLLLLQEKSKRRMIRDPNLRDSLGAEATSGFWNRSFFFWVNELLFLGFRKILDLDDLDDIGPDLLTSHLNEKFSLVWARTRKDTTHCLAKACAKSLAWPIIKVIIPRLCFTAFTFSQPLLIRRVVSFLNNETNDLSSSYGHGLIGATVLIYLGIGLSRAIYSHQGFYLVTSARGILVSQILTKSLALEHSEASQTAAMTLMSTDVESLTTGLPRFIAFSVSFIEVGIGIYILYTVVRNAAFLMLISLLISTVVAYCIGERSSPAMGRWNEKVQYRVSQTLLVIKHITGIKMLGLDSQIQKYIQNLRIEELKTSQVYRMLVTITITMLNFSLTITPVIVLAGAIFLSSSERLSAVQAFTSLGIILLVSEPITTIISGYAAFRMALACVQRIQVYLLKEERKDYRTPMQGRLDIGRDLDEKAGPSTYPDLNAALPGTGDTVIQARQISIKDQSTDRHLLRDASFSIQRSKLTIVAGAVGSGKSLLLRAMLGEVKFEGTLSFVDTGMIAYCDQTPWIRNTSIRENIIGDIASIDDAWYEMVVEACLLTDDFLQLPEGDETLAGSEGVSLSGGQKQRVSLARAIYSRAAILILDDPLSGLDRHTLQGVVSNLFAANGLLKQLRTTVIMVTHSAYCGQFASSIISLDGMGNLTTTDIIRGTMQSEQALTTILNESAPSTGVRVDSAESNDNAEEETEAAVNERAEKLRLSEAQEDTLRRKGGLALYKFYLRSVTRWMLVIWLVTVVLAGLSISTPALYIRIWLETDADNNRYFIGFALLGLLGCVLTAVTYWFYYTYVVMDSGSSLHKKLLDTTLRATLSYLTDTDSGVIINRFSQDITLITRDLPRHALLFMFNVSNTTFTSIIILSGARFAAAFLPLILVVLYVFQHFYLRTSRQMRYLDLEAKTPLYTQLAETATGIYHIRSYGIVAKVLNTGLKLLDISQKPFYYMFCIQRWLMLGMDLTALGMAVMLVSFAVLQKNNSQAAIGLSLVNMINLPLQMSYIIENWTVLETSLGAIARIRNFERDTPTEQDTNCEAPQNWPNQGHIVLSSVTAVYSSTDVPNEVLSNVSIEITPGQKIGVIGRTGSGKSSLLLSILNFLEYQGTIYIDGRDISTVPRRVLRSQITTVTQNPIELDASVRYNLLPFQLDRSDETNQSYDAEAVEVLCRVHLWNYIAIHGGLDKKMTDMAFSSGQMQILSIARAILHNRFTNSKIVLMDEPTSNIDLENDAHIQNVLCEAFDSCTVLTIAHRHETLIHSDMILELSEGQVVQFSPPRNTTSMSSSRDSRSMSSFRDSRSMSSFR